MASSILPIMLQDLAEPSPGIFCKSSSVRFGNFSTVCFLRIFLDIFKAFSLAVPVRMIRVSSSSLDSGVVPSFNNFSLILIFLF